MQSRLKDLYEKEIKKSMMKHFKYKNSMEIPKINKIILNMGLGKRRDVKRSQEILTTVAGQHATYTKFKKSVAQFGVREGQLAGALVSLRNNKMYHFMDRLFLAMINWKTFFGLNPNSISKVGKKTQINFGIPDLSIFQGVDSQRSNIEGCNITFVTNCKTKEELIYLIESFNIPFRSMI